MKFKILITSLFCISTYTFSQTRVADSARNIIYATQDPAKKLTAILDFCDQYQSVQRDTVYNYALQAISMAKQQHNSTLIARSQLALANAYYLWGWVDSSRAFCDSALQKVTAADAGTRTVYFKALRQKALCYGGVQKFPEALDILYRLLREAEQYNDNITLAYTCNTIGSVKINMNKSDEALTWITKALGYDTKNNSFIPVKAAALTNAAFAYMSKEQTDSAMFFINQALPLCRQAENLNTLATALRIRSNLFTQAHGYDKAEADLREMLSIRRMQTGGYSNITDDNIQLANFYANTGQLQKAIDFCKQNLHEGDTTAITDSLSLTTHLSNKLEYYKTLAGLYKQAGMNAEYTSTLEDIINAKDSFYESNSSQAIAEIQTKYETEQKEKTILQQKYDLTKKNFVIYGSLAFFILSATIFYLLFREYRRRQKLKMQQAMKEEKAAKEIAVKEAEEKERKRIAADLHDNLGVQANAILYNTELLKTEKNATLVDDLHDTAKQMLLNLRETLWAMKTNDIAAAELWLRIINFAKQMGRHYPHIQFAAKGTAPATMQLNSAKALNIVMIVQEAVQNAVKHSNSKTITITSAALHNSWQIQVTDNGNGFELDNALEKSDSHGLKNILDRAKQSNIKINVHSGSNENTSIELNIEDTKEHAE